MDYFPLREDMVGFEDLLATISAGPGRRPELFIAHGLREITRFFGADHACLLNVSSGMEGTSQETVSNPCFPVSDPEEIFHLLPWTVEKVRQGRPVAVQALGELPAETERQGCLQLGTSAYLCVPTWESGKVRFALLIAMATKDRHWSEVDLSRAQLSGQLLADTVARQRGEITLQERVKFEQLLADLTCRFLNLPPQNLEKGIEDTLRQLAEFFQLDRCSLYRFSEEKAELRIVCTHVAKGMRPIRRVDPGRQFPWIWEQMLQGETTCLSSAAELPAGAALDRKHMACLGVKSFIGFPISTGGTIHFVLTLSSMRREVRWVPELISRLRMIGQVIGNALSRNQAETESRRFQAELVHRERLDIMSYLTATIAHEISQPLGAILSHAQAALRFLKAAEPSLDEVHEALEDIVADDKRAAEIIRRLRAMHRKSAEKREPFDLNELIGQVILLIQREFTLRNIVVRKNFSTGLRLLKGDTIQLQQVILNLLLNALEALRTRPAENRFIEISTVALKDDSIMASFRNTGPELTPEIIERVFDPFFTTKPKGSGMGLAISKSIIETHGGWLWAENHPEGGALFAFKLPLPNKTESVVETA